MDMAYTDNMTFYRDRADEVSPHAHTSVINNTE